MDLSILEYLLSAGTPDECPPPATTEPDDEPICEACGAVGDCAHLAALAALEAIAALKEVVHVR